MIKPKHPLDRCGVVPAGAEQVSSAWLAQLREEYRVFGAECQRLQAENKALLAENERLHCNVLREEARFRLELFESEKLRKVAERRLQVIIGIREQAKAWKPSSVLALRACSALTDLADAELMGL